MSDHLPHEIDPTGSGHFDLGTDTLGRTWSLDLQTGDVRHAPADTPTIAESNATVIHAREFTQSRLIRILGEGGWEVTVDSNDGAAAFLTELGPLTITVRQEERALRFSRTYRWVLGAESWESAEDRAMGIEALNRSASFMRFVPAVDGTTFDAAYDVPLIAGLTRAQLLDLVRRFVSELRRPLATTGVREGVE